MAMGDEVKDLLKNSEQSDTDEAGTDSGVAAHVERRIVVRNVPLGTWLLEKAGLCNCRPKISYRALIYVLTFCCYTTYHLSRKPFSVVKVVLCPDCVDNISTSPKDALGFGYMSDNEQPNKSADDILPPGWYPFNGGHGKTLMGAVDYSWLFAYAIAMFFSGMIADRVNLRYFLTFGMLGTGISVALLGVAYYADIHHIAYFIVIQVLGGVMQSTGWPGVVAVMSSWFGKQRRGFIMGIWNAHTSVGNILGTIIPSFWANYPWSPWGWCFFVPGLIISVMGVITFLFLVKDPTDVGLPPPVHHLDGEATVVTSTTEVSHGTSTYQRKSSELGGSGGEEAIEAKKASSGSIQVQQRGAGQYAAPRQVKTRAVGFFKALMIPGVIEFSLALFFNKLVAYTFLYWLPFYVKTSLPMLSGEQADWLSTLFDVGGIVGGITAGLVSDLLDARAVTCVIMLLLAVPSLFLLRIFGGVELWGYIVLLIVCGTFVNGPYGLITTAVSSDLSYESVPMGGVHRGLFFRWALFCKTTGTHKYLKDNQNAKATVTAIIDGTGSLGAAFGPLIIGWLSDDYTWTSAFYFLMGSCLVSALLLSRLVVSESIRWYRRFRNRRLTYRTRPTARHPDSPQLLVESTTEL